jgi:prohibitin 2
LPPGVKFTGAAIATLQLLPAYAAGCEGRVRLIIVGRRFRACAEVVLSAGFRKTHFSATSPLFRLHFPRLAAMPSGMNSKYLAGAFVLGALLLAVIVVLLFFTTTVETGNVGVVTNFGRVTGEVLDSGWHIVGPVDHVTEMSIRTFTTQTDATCFSADLQAVTITLAVQTRITKDNAIDIFKNYGVDFMGQATPKILDALKAETAKYEAAEIIANRDQIRNEALKAAQGRLQGFVEVQDLSIVNVEFSADYEHAIEAKQVAQQRAEQAKYELQQAQVEADKKVAEARGEAEAIQIRGDALAKNPQVIDLELINKWDGKAPDTLVTSGGTSSVSSIVLPIQHK